MISINQFKWFWIKIKVSRKRRKILKKSKKGSSLVFWTMSYKLVKILFKNSENRKKKMTF